MEIYSLASGSKGNCTLVQTTFHTILIDVGISMKQINERMLMANGTSLDDVTIILITHSHIDHIQSVRSILNKYSTVKVYCSDTTYEEINAHFKTMLPLERFIISSVKTNGKNIDITPFGLNHDVETQGYMIEDKFANKTYVHICDNGKLYDKELIDLIYDKDYYSIESNHDLTLQINDSKRHEGLKRRVLGFYGHTANHDAIELAFKLVGDNTKGIIFNHLSEHCNNEELCRLTHDNLIGIWGHRTLFKQVHLKYARQDEIVFIE